MARKLTPARQSAMTRRRRPQSALDAQAAAYRNGGAPLDVERLARAAWTNAPLTLPLAANPSARRAYAETRARGWSVTRSVGLARDIATAESVMPSVSWIDNAETYAVDPLALELATSSPAPNVTGPNGEPVVHKVSLPAGAVATVRTPDDDSRRPDDNGEDCYDADDVAAWERNEWIYAGTVVTVTLADGREGEASIWGTEVGPYWPGTDRSQIWHNVPDLVAEALAEALEQTLSWEERATATKSTLLDALASWDGTAEHLHDAVRTAVDILD